MTLGRALRHASALEAAEWRTLAAACGLQLVLRRLIAVWPLDRVSSFTAFRPSRRSPQVEALRLRRLAKWSTRLCGGTCLTESFTLRALSGRAGVDLPVTVGVIRDDTVLHAHAWAGDTGSGSFLPLWRSSGGRGESR